MALPHDSADSTARNSLRAAQARLIEDLARASDPNAAGTDRTWPGLNVAAGALRRKRIRGMEKAWPELRDLLDGQWPRVVQEYIVATGPLRAGDDARRDGARLIAWLSTPRPSPRGADSLAALCQSPVGTLLRLRARLLLGNSRLATAWVRIPRTLVLIVVWLWGQKTCWRMLPVPFRTHRDPLPDNSYNSNDEYTQDGDKKK